MRCSGCDDQEVRNSQYQCKVSNVLQQSIFKPVRLLGCAIKRWYSGFFMTRKGSDIQSERNSCQLQWRHLQNERFKFQIKWLTEEEPYVKGIWLFQRKIEVSNCSEQFWFSNKPSTQIVYTISLIKRALGFRQCKQILLEWMLSGPWAHLYFSCLEYIYVFVNGKLFFNTFPLLSNC